MYLLAMELGRESSKHGATLTRRRTSRFSTRRLTRHEPPSLWLFPLEPCKVPQPAKPVSEDIERWDGLG
jgi:hypothetical protein